MGTSNEKARICSSFRNWVRRRLLINPRIQYPVLRTAGALRSFLYTFRLGRNLKSSDSEFLFLVGAGRSGNTLLRKLLMERASIYIPPESYVIPSVIVGLLRAGGLTWEQQVEFVLGKFEHHPEFHTFGISSLSAFATIAKVLPEEDHSLGLLLNRMYFWLASSKEITADWVGDKTPLNTYSLGLLNAILPDARYVYIERDGVDVAVSYVSAGIYKTLGDAAVRWKNSKLAWRAFRKLLRRQRYYEVRYEELVDRPDQVIDELIDHLGLTRRPERLQVGTDLGDVVLHEHHENVLLAPRKDSIGKGRVAISPEERQWLGPILNDELLESGYERI